MKKLFGVTTAMTTPFTCDDRIDVASIRETVDFLISKGVHGLYPLGTTGEMLHLTLDERKLVAQTVVEAAAGRVNVFVNCGANTTRDAVQLARHAASVGADGIGAVTPYFLKVSDRELEEYYVTLARCVPEDFPLYMYSIPQCAANDIDPAVCQAVRRRCPNVAGIKYSYADFSRLIDYCSLGDGFSVMIGPDLLFLQGMTVGCDGVVSGISGIFPEPFVAVYNAYMAGNLKEAERLQRLCVAYVRILRAGSNMAYFKAAMDYRGLRGGHMRAPQLNLTPAEKEAFLAELKAMDVYGAI